MEKLGFGLDDDSSTRDQKQTNPQESRGLSIRCWIQSLVHACQCIGANCRLPGCRKMKRFVQHAKSCKRKASSCRICKQLISLCCYHAKHCQEAKCPVPYCLNSKHKLRQLQQRQQQPQILKRHIPTMQNRGMSGSVPSSRSPPTPSPNLIATQQQMQAQMRKPITQMLPGVPNCMLGIKNVACWGENSNYTQNPQPHPSPHPQPKGLRPQSQLMEPNSMDHTVTTIGPPQVMPNPPVPSLNMPMPTSQVLKQLLQVLKSPTSPQQQQQVLAILKSNPQLAAAFMKQRTDQQQQQPQQQQMLLNETNMIGPPQTNVWCKQQQQHFIAMQRQQQPNQFPQPMGLRPQSQLMGPSGMSNSMGNTVTTIGPPQVMLNPPGPSLNMPTPTSQALQHLLLTLKSPTSPQQEQQVVAILKSNPQLMAAFLKQRTALQQQQQQQQQEMLLNEVLLHLKLMFM